MAEIKRIEYRSVIVEGGTRSAAAVLGELCSRGIRLTGFSLSRRQDGGVQLDLAARSADRLTQCLRDMHLSPAIGRVGFLVTTDSGGCPVVGVLEQLDRAGIPITAAQSSESGRRTTAVVWVEPENAQRAGEVLDAWQIESDVVDEASDESFPASDSPAWVYSGKP